MELGRIDLEPSHAEHTRTHKGRYLIWELEVHGEYGLRLGTLVVRTIGDPKTGRLQAESASLE